MGSKKIALYLFLHIKSEKETFERKNRIDNDIYNQLQLHFYQNFLNVLMVKLYYH